MTKRPAAYIFAKYHYATTTIHLQPRVLEPGYAGMFGEDRNLSKPRGSITKGAGGDSDFLGGICRV